MEVAEWADTDGHRHSSVAEDIGGGGLRGQDRDRARHLHEVMDGLQVGQVVVADVHADAEVQAGVASVNDLEIPELRAEGMGEWGQGLSHWAGRGWHFRPLAAGRVMRRKGSTHPSPM